MFEFGYFFDVVSNFSQVLQKAKHHHYLFLFLLESQHICRKTRHQIYHKPHKSPYIF